MSTPSEIIAKAQRQTGSNSVSYPSTDAILDLNNRRAILHSRIQKEVDEGHFWTYSTADFVSGQSEYTIDSVGGLDINEIDGVSVKYNSTDTNYTKVKRKSYEALDSDMQAYETYAGEPFYFVKDRSVFVYPAPTSTITNGIKIFSINQPADVTTSSTEDDMKLDPRFHQYVVWGMCADYWYSKLRDDKGDYWEKKFEQGGTEMVKALKNREQESLEYEVSINPYA